MPKECLPEHLRARIGKARTGDSFKDRWKDVVIWKSFWQELEAILLSRTYDSFEAGYKQGAKDSKEAAFENYAAGVKAGAEHWEKIVSRKRKEL